MAEELRAVPDLLSELGIALSDHGRSLLVLHQSFRSDVDDAQPGWVGSSAGELPGLLERWSAASTSHARRVDEHSSGMHLAAAELAEMDQHNATALR